MLRHKVSRVPIGLLAAVVTLASACGGAPSSEDDDLPFSDLDDLPLAVSSLEAGEPARFEQGTHCGFRILDMMINGQVWRAEGASGGDWFPTGWKPDRTLPDGPVTIQLVLAEDESTIVASLNGTEVAYTAGGEEWEESDLCA